MRLAAPAPPEMFPWIAARAGLVVGPQFRAIAAVDDKGRIAGMVGYDAWTESAVSMHVAIENPLAVRTLIKPAFRIPFLELGKRVVFGTVLSSNEKALEFDKHLGFREVSRLRDAWAVGVDMIILELRREDCRWIGKEAARWAA